MYLFKENNEIKINKTIAAEIIGITRTALSKIINRKVACRKVVAFSITKYLDERAEIEDYFEKII